MTRASQPVAPALRKRLVLALDTPDVDSALELVRRTRGVVGTFKVGLELYTADGGAVLQALAREDAEVFLDLKLHDIPNTVAGAVRAAMRHGVALLTVHASGGPAMLAAAQEALASPTSAGGTKLLAVTALTHLTAEELAAIGMQGAPDQIVLRLAQLAKDAGLFGIVCSPREAALVKRNVPGLAIVCPGIRAATSAALGNIPADDQVRTATAFDAVRAGADYIVVGRPIRMAPDPAEAAAKILQEIEQGLQARS